MNISVAITAGAIIASFVLMFAAYAASAHTLGYDAQNAREAPLIRSQSGICNQGIGSRIADPPGHSRRS